MSLSVSFFNPQTFASNDLPAVDFLKLNSFNQRIEEVVENFKKNNQNSKCYYTLKKIQQEVDLYFVEHEKPEVHMFEILQWLNNNIFETQTSQYLELMSEICSKINQNPIVDSISNQFMKKPSQKHNSNSNYLHQLSSDIGQDDDSHIDSNKNSFRQREIDDFTGEENVALSSSHRNSIFIPKPLSRSSTLVENINAYPSSFREPNTKLLEKESKFTTLMKKLEELISDIQIQIDQRRLLQANKQVQKIEEFIRGSDQLDLSDEEASEIVNFQQRHYKLIEIVKDDAELIYYNLEVLQAEDGWITEKQKGKIKIMYQYPDPSTMSLRMESEVNIPLKNLLCLGNEMEYFKDYLPFIEEGKLLKEVRRATKLGYALMDVPMISKRECYFYGVGFNLLEEYGCIPMVSKSIHSDKEFCQKQDLQIPPQKKHVRLDYKYYVFNITPLGPNKCFVKIVLNVDYKINFVPKSIQNWCARKFAMHLFEKIIKKATNFAGSPWERAMKQQKDFYDWLDSLIDQFLKNTGLTNDSYSLEDAKAKIEAYIKKRKEDKIDD